MKELILSRYHHLVQILKGFYQFHKELFIAFWEVFTWDGSNLYPREYHMIFNNRENVRRYYEACDKLNELKRGGVYHSEVKFTLTTGREITLLN